MKHLALVVVMMITSTFTFSQHIGKVYIGNSMEKTIEQCNELGYELVTKDKDYLKFFVPNNNETYDFDITLLLFASPESKTIWFGVMTFDTENKKEKKMLFRSMSSLLEGKHGNPYQKRRKSIKWDTGHSFVYIENTKKGVKYTVISTGSFFKVEGEY